jgi:hypothetical protein
MPSKTDSDIFLICVGLFIIIIVAMMFSTSGLSPYDKHGANSLTQYPYEGFASAMEYFHNRKAEPVDYVSTTATTAATTTAAAVKLEGFEGLQSGAFVPEQRIDDIIYSSAGPDCNGKTFGLSTSKGFLCLSDKDVKLLTSRGGNA